MGTVFTAAYCFGMGVHRRRAIEPLYRRESRSKSVHFADEKLEFHKFHTDGIGQDHLLHDYTTDNNF